MTAPNPSTAGVVRLTISIPAGLAARLDQLAEAERRNRSNAAALLIERGLARLADAKRAS